MRLTAKDRILLHLLESAPREDDVEVPSTLTQEGLARGTGVEQRHLAQSLRPLVAEGLVRERIRHVAGRPQRMKVYDLTPSGRQYAIRLREQVKAEVVRVRERDAVRELRLQDALEGTGAATSLLQAARQVDQLGVLDLEAIARPAEPGHVEHLRDAPQVTRFLGRREELEALTQADAGPRVFVIRGIPGIGKSLLAAKACNEMRGRCNLFWHRIRPWESGLTILANLGRFLEAVDRPGLSAVLKRGDSGMAGEVLRQDLPDTHALLVLDDAHEASPEGLTVIRMLVEATASAPDVRLLILTRRALPFYDTRDMVLHGVVREIELGGLGPEDAAALLSEGGGLGPLAPLVHRLGGHPLLLELVRSHRTDLPQAVYDARRFLEDTVYKELSDSEKAIMKAASLYQVAVPEQTFLSLPSSSYEAFVDLKGRSLLRFLENDRYELHDTVRNFFAEVLTPSELREYGALAVSELRRLASESHASGDLTSSVDYLSNALRVAVGSQERVALLEELGEARAEIGDLPGAVTAFQDALRAVPAPETSARLHRRIAVLYCERDDIEDTVRELDAALDVLGGRDSVERGWVDLVKGRIARLRGDSEATRAWYASALERFRAKECLPGEAETHLRLGARVVDQQVDLAAAVGSLQRALSLAETLDDPTLASRAHAWLGYIAAFGVGDPDEGIRQFDAADAALTRENAVVRLRTARFRGWLKLHLLADFDGARACFEESLRLSRKCHSALLAGYAEWGLSTIPYYQGDWRALLERRRPFAIQAQQVGSPAILIGAIDEFAISAVILGARDDVEMAVRLFDGTDSKEVGVRAYLDSVRGLLRLATGDHGAAKASLEDALKVDADAYPIQFRDDLHYPAFFYSLALRLEGRESEADAYMEQAMECLRRYHRKSMIALLPELERRLLEVLPRA